MLWTQPQHQATLYSPGVTTKESVLIFEKPALWSGRATALQKEALAGALPEEGWPASLAGAGNHLRRILLVSGSFCLFLPDTCCPKAAKHARLSGADADVIEDVITKGSGSCWCFAVCWAPSSPLPLCPPGHDLVVKAAHCIQLE